MVAIASDADGAPKTPLPARERWLLGGAGAIAPLIVLAIGLDWENVFTVLKWGAALGYLVKAALLFLVGGFVGFLQKSETDQFKCFLIGISAPALIATAAATKAQGADRLDALAGTIQVQTIESAFQEGFSSQFFRGLSSRNPTNTVGLVGTELSPDLARRSAAAVLLFTDCSIQGKTIPRGGAERLLNETELRKQGLSSQVIVLSLGAAKKDVTKYVVAMLLGDPEIAFSYVEILRKWVPMDPVFVINQARAYSQVSSAIQENLIEPLPPDFADILVKKHVLPDCIVRRP